MRLAYLTTEFVTEDYFSGGLANYLHRLGKMLSDRGHDVHILTYSRHPVESFPFEGMWVHRLKEGGRIEKQLNRISRYQRMTVAKYIDFSYECYRKLIALQDKKKFDCIQTTNYQFPGLFSNMRLKTPQVLRLTSYSPVWFDKAGLDVNGDMRLMLRIEDWQIRQMRYIFAPSHAVAEMVQKHTRRSRPDVIPTPFELDTPPEKWDDEIYRNIKAGGPYLLYFGRFQAHKGFVKLAEALVGAMGDIPDLRVVFVGKDAQAKEIPSTKKHAQNLLAGFGQRVIFQDELHHNQLYPIISGARLVALPALIDNLPNAALEAMALGRPVIGTTGTSFDEMLEDGWSGFLTQSDDPNALRQSIREIWNRRDLDEIGMRAQIAAERYDPERCLPPLLEFYKKAINSKRKIN
jgi:glycosyltransferase involved in cell wall biosynthesis